eukprot:370054-Rhodomonas_salina.3
MDVNVLGPTPRHHNFIRQLFLREDLASRIRWQSPERAHKTMERFGGGSNSPLGGRSRGNPAALLGDSCPESCSWSRSPERRGLLWCGLR